MGKRRKIILLLLLVYAIGLVWGQVRLPFAAVKNLADYDLLRDKPFVATSDDQLHMLAMQRWYLKRAMKLVDGTGPTRISADVKSNWGIVARVRSGLYISPMGAESLDGLYVCVFGAWFQVYGFGHAMAQGSVRESVGYQESLDRTRAADVLYPSHHHWWPAVPVTSIRCSVAAGSAR